MMEDEVGRLGVADRATAADAVEPQGVSSIAGIPDAVWVIVRSTGEYSDRVETPIRFCLSEQEAKMALELIPIEAARDAHKKPVYKRASVYGFQMPDGSWLPDGVGFSDPLVKERAATWKPLPDAESIEHQNNLWAQDYEQACIDLGHVDPSGSWCGSYYYCEKVTLWSAQAIEARRAETGTGSVHESAVRKDGPKEGNHNG